MDTLVAVICVKDAVEEVLAILPSASIAEDASGLCHLEASIPHPLTPEEMASLRALGLSGKLVRLHTEIGVDTPLSAFPLGRGQVPTADMLQPGQEIRKSWAPLKPLPPTEMD